MHCDQGHVIADGSNDFIGWEILGIERWKEGVSRVHMRQKSVVNNSVIFMMLYSKDEYLPKGQS